VRPLECGARGVPGLRAAARRPPSGSPRAARARRAAGGRASIRCLVREQLAEQSLSQCLYRRAPGRGRAEPARRLPTREIRLKPPPSPQTERSRASPDRKRNSAVLPERKPAAAVHRLTPHFRAARVRVPPPPSPPDAPLATAAPQRCETAGRAPDNPALLPTEVEADQLELGQPLTCSASILVMTRVQHAGMPVRPQGTGEGSDRGTRSYIGHLLARAQSRTAVWPLASANTHTLQTHGQPFARAHWSTVRCPP
jgi:hypothetical protein